MALRKRVPRRKMLEPGSKQRRNVTPKLSPYQREQKRNRLANQAPDPSAVHSDIPHSARFMFDHLRRVEERIAAAKARREAAAEAAAAAERAEPEQGQEEDDDHHEKPRVTRSAATVVARSEEKCKKKRAGQESTTPATLDSVAVVDRQERVKRLEPASASPAPKGKGTTAPVSEEAGAQSPRHVHFAADAAVAAHSVDESAGTPTSGAKPLSALSAALAGRKRPRPGFTAEGTRKPIRDFDQLTDHVRFGERVDAPPMDLTSGGVRLPTMTPYLMRHMQAAAAIKKRGGFSYDETELM